MNEQMPDRAQSESIGVILLVGVVIITVSVGGAYAMGTITQSAGGPDVAFTSEIGTDGITLSHQGGDSLPGDDLRLIVRVNESETGLGWSDGTLSGSDDTFDPGEEWAVSRSYDPGSLVTVWLVDKPSNTVLFQTEATVKTQEPVVSGVGGNIDAIDRQGEIEQSDISTPRSDGTGDDEEGEDADGPSEPWLDVDDDGRFEEDDGDATVDLSGGEVPSEQKNEDATLRIPAGVTVDTGSDQLDIDDVDRIRVAGTVRSEKKIDLAADSISLDDGRVDNTDGSLQLIVDSETSLTADGAVLASANVMELRSNDAMSVDDADIDNTAGDKGLNLDSEAGLTADGSTLTSAGKTEILSKDDMSVQSAVVDNSEGDNVDIFVESKSDLTVDSTVFNAADEITLKSGGEKSTQDTEQNENEG